ncbi:MAG: threonine synthase [Bacteroidales bacterium]|nr:threonine synthase [Bacteroidales bacterium]
MDYYSTRNRALKFGLKEALMKGLAPDGGLFMPSRIPILSRGGLEELREMNLTQIALKLSELLFGEDIPGEDLKAIVEGAVNFDTPLVKVEEGIYALELFHGPTLAFKDVGARFLARLLGHFTRDMKEDIHVLVATSGDTGSAVANGFLGVPGVKVHVLYPSGLVSPLQEKQFTTLGENISAVEVKGTFDDCQKLVKEAFMDQELAGQITLTSANSINLARFLPQAFYYFRAWAQMDPETRTDPETQLFFSVPSGNYGNMTAGLVAREMGLPVHTFLSANNINDVVPVYLLTGKFKPRPSTATIANAMDVGDPSNFDRILDLFDHKHKWITTHMQGFSYSDHEIREIISRVYRKTGYLCDPHGATGYQAARTFMDDHPGYTGIFLETAHPAKFKESVEEVTGKPVEIPERLAVFADREKTSTPLKPAYRDFKSYLLNQ